MILENDEVFKTFKARNAVFEKLQRNLGLCDTEESVKKFREEHFFELIAIKVSDEQLPGEPVYEWIQNEIEQHLLLIKEKERENAFRE